MTGVLSVVPSWLKVLANMHKDISGQIASATSSIAGVDQRVATTHGSHTSNFNTALTELVTARNSTGTGIQGVASGLASTLISAATAYLNTDLFGGGLLDKQVNI
jgi:hypothetical protein